MSGSLAGLQQCHLTFISNGVNVNFEVLERSGKIISTGTPLRLVLAYTSARY